MRSVAPERPGSAASQKRWSTVKSKPMAGMRATTTDHTIQTEKASRSAGIEIQRLRVAMARPELSQNEASSGRQSCRTGPRAAAAQARAPGWQTARA